MLALRPPVADDLALLVAWDADPAAAGAFDEAGGSPREYFQRRWVEEPPDPRDQGYRVLAEDGRAIGTATWIRHPLDRWVGLFGVMIAVPADRGRGLGTRAHRLVVDWLFSEQPDLAKLEAWTDVDHAVEQRVLEKAGFAREGILRRRNELRGLWRDMAVYGLLRDEWSVGG